MQLNVKDLKLILKALNDRESVLATEYEQAARDNAFPAGARALLRDQLTSEMNDVRALAYRVQERIKFC